MKTRMGTGKKNPNGGMDHRSDPNNQAENERQLQKPVGDLITRRPANKIQGEGLGILRGNEDRGRVRGVPWGTVGAAVGELRWGRRDAGNRAGAEVHTGGMTAGEHREGKQ